MFNWTHVEVENETIFAFIPKAMSKMLTMGVELDGPPSTGDEAVDEVLQAVSRLMDLPLEEHPSVLKQAQDALHDYLTADS